MSSKNDKYDILSVLSDYLYRYFPCQICEEHFSQNMSSPLFEKTLRFRKYSNAVRLYVFHNIVNQHTGKPDKTVWLEKPFEWKYDRVMKTKSEIEGHRVINMKVLFLKAYYEEQTKIVAKIDGEGIYEFLKDKDGVEEKVRKFLDEFYGPLFEDCNVEAEMFVGKEVEKKNVTEVRKVKSERNARRSERALKR